MVLTSQSYGGRVQDGGLLPSCNGSNGTHERMQKTWLISMEEASICSTAIVAPAGGFMTAPAEGFRRPEMASE